MANEESREQSEARERQEKEDALRARFPDVPVHHDVPHAPVLKPTLPPHPARPRPGAVEPGGHQKMALATTAASSFITPILVLSVGGYFLDKKLHHTTDWFAFLGVVVGMIVGVTSLLRIINRLSD